jgi:hypothetical protein
MSGGVNPHNHHDQLHNMLQQCKQVLIPPSGSDAFSPGACIIEGLHCKGKMTLCAAVTAASL